MKILCPHPTKKNIQKTTSKKVNRIKSSLKILFFTLILFNSSSIFAQGEAANWFFGENVGLRFDPITGLTSGIAGSPIDTNEGCASISDSDGNLLFYTDGTTVWNRNHVEIC